jgi:peptidoglycan/LPS O-acetylase OafA/YrhL
VTRHNRRRRLALAWWWQLLLVVLPVVVISRWFGASQALAPLLAMPAFIVGISSMFVSLRPFGRYKHALIATGKALDTPEEDAAWRNLDAARRKALLAASLPAWIAAIAVFTGLETVPLCLLTLSSVVLLYLYRIPRQLA